MTTEQGNKLIAVFDSLIPAINGIPDYDRHWELLMPVVEKIEQITLKEVIGVAASKPYWQDDKLTVGIGWAIRPNDNLLFKEARDFPACFTINNKTAWIQHYFAAVSGGDGHFSMTNVSATSKIEATWELVIQFIQWHNEQKLKTDNK